MPSDRPRSPLIARLDEERAFDREDGAHDGEPYTAQDAMLAFDFGLERVLDGLEAFVAAKKKSPKPAPAPKATPAPKAKQTRRRA